MKKNSYDFIYDCGPKNYVWTSVYQYNAGGDHYIALDEDLCANILPADFPLNPGVTDGPIYSHASTLSRHMHKDGEWMVDYMPKSDDQWVTCMKRECSTNPCVNGGVCFSDNNGDSKPFTVNFRRMIAL